MPELETETSLTDAEFAELLKEFSASPPPTPRPRRASTRLPQGRMARTAREIMAGVELKHKESAYLLPPQICEHIELFIGHPSLSHERFIVLLGEFGLTVKQIFCVESGDCYE